MNYTAIGDGIDPDNEYSGYDFSNEVINLVNIRLANNQQMHMPPGNNTAVIDRKYRLLLSSVHYWESNQYWGSLNLTALMNNFAVNPGTEINVFFQSHQLDGSGILGGIANQSGNLGCIIRGCWNVKAEFDDPNTWLSAFEVMHETGHNLSLAHTMRASSGPCVNYDIDGLSDTPTRSEIIAMGLPDPCCPSLYLSSECSNNMMDYSGADAITPQQLGKIHYALSHGLINYLDEAYCEKNMALIETINSSEDLIWNNVRFFGGDIILESGAKLTIRCKVYMPEGAKIIVKSGAKLIVDGGTLTHRCGGLWKGVEVWGNYQLPQEPESNQGVIQMMNLGTIEWAENAIGTIAKYDDGTIDWSKTGGIVQCKDANFYNNKCSVGFMAYHNFNSSGQIANVSSFKRCHFEVDDVSRFSNQSHNCFITMWDVNGVKIYGCDFKNIAPDITLNQRGDGLFTIWSTFKIGDICNVDIPYGTSCSSNNTVRCSFENLRYGVRAAGPMTNLLLSIEHARFIDNMRGVFLSGFGKSQIIKNDFEWHEIVEESQEKTYGVYLQECTGYEVEENFFDGHDGEETYGIAVNNSGENATQIYRNTFHRCHAASMVYGLNRILNDIEQDDAGLEWSCNIYGQNGNSSKMNYYGIGLWNNASHSSYQGVLASAGAAGNLFYPECDPFITTSNDERELKLMEQESPSYFDYIHTPAAATQPLCRTFGIGLSDNLDFTSVYGVNNYCIKNISSEKPFVYHKPLIGANHTIYSQLRPAYDGYINNGTGAQLALMVIDPAVSSVELRNALMDAAPSVTDDLLIKALHRLPAMDGWHMAQALLANSPLKDAVLVELKKSDYLDYYKSLVENNQPGGISTRTLMAMDAAHYRSERDHAKDDLIRCYAGDYEQTTYWPELIQATSEFDYCFQPWEIASIHLEKGDYAMANTLLENCSGDEARCEILQFGIDMQQFGMGSTGLSPMQQAQLETIAGNSDHLMNATANVILEFWGGVPYEEFLALPEGASLKSRQIKEQTDAVEIKAIHVFPNPANDILKLTCLLPNSAETATLSIYNPLGQIISVSDARKANGIFEMATKDWPAGIYMIEFVADGIKLGTATVSIVH